MSNRPSWEEYFKQLTIITAQRSSCEKLHVGCLFVKDNRIIAQGYNGYLPGAPHKQVIRDNHEIATVHAEQNTISDCAKRGVSCNGATAYITHYPCINCAKLLFATGIKDIKYIEDYNNDSMIPYFANQLCVKITKI
tara:strand:- start:8821 stop:9231 length:411 start_codon:yes stop_codon:yes gene_type:complete